ncbi:N-acetylmuramoyl-L-alanine amidase [Nonomuraea sp. NPDC049625]|uniref:N-acetylmuramoyl-L-alanine amidase n=1 Tax=Nonomuraea sp. NPDC049625 TaxID=3155775 RepID=UPI003440785C
MQWKHVRKAALCAAVGGLLLTARPAVAAQPDGLDKAFADATAEYQVPKDLLVAVGYGETHLDGHNGAPSSDNGYGVMHLVSNPQHKTLEQAAKLTGEPEADLKSDAAANIRGGAAVLRALADQAGLDASKRKDVNAWYPVVARYGGAADDQVARLYADTVYGLLTQGIKAEVVVQPRKVRPERGTYEKVKPLAATTGEPQAGLLSTDYPPAHWVPANGNNYSPGRSSPIRKIVIHVTQGSYAGTISWFQNPSAQVSAHYVIRSSDGDVTQMVRDTDTAYHARSSNAEALGIEHEGFVDNPSWFTDAMYRSSAALTRYLADKWGIPRTRANIVGHNELPGNDHTDPGPHWNWDYYMSLVNGGGGSLLGGSPADFDGDGKDDIVTFTHGANADVYVAKSTGTAFDGTSVKWHDYFALSGEVPLTGDFTGDGKDDIVTFTQGANADVYVAPSTGNSFGAATKWHDFFAPSGEVPAVGDFDGDGKDDIVTFTRGTANDVYVALSNDHGFGAGVKWHDWFALNGEFPAVGDVNGDGKDDIIVFTQGSTNDVYVATSTGTGFNAAVKMHDNFALAGEQPRIADVNGDGKDDIVTFTNNNLGDVWVAISDGQGFGPGVKWNDWFAPNGEFPYTGDFDGDGKDDIVTFTKGSTNDVFVGLSNGTSAFGAGVKWHDFFGLNGETTL